MAMKLAMKDPRYHWNEMELKQIIAMDIIRMFEKSTKKGNLETLKTINAQFLSLLPQTMNRLAFFVRTARLSRKLEWIHSDFFEGTESTLENLHQKGIILGIVTNSGKKRLDKWLNRKKVGKYFSNYTTRADRNKFGSKPSPKPILGILKRLQEQHGWNKINLSKVAFIGDNLTDVLAGQRAKVISIACLCGHGDPTEIQKLTPDFLLNNINEIPMILHQIFPSLKKDFSTRE
jgi:phosphoglycolate phosphatase-like HAD superfamily hydrolase